MMLAKRYTGYEILSFAIAAAVFLIIFLPQTKHYSFFYDDYVNLKQARAISENPASIFSPNDKGRRLPVFSFLIFLESRFFRNNPTPYFVILYLIHFFNALLVRGLAYRLRVSPRAALLSALFFFCSSSAYQALIFIPSTAVVLATFFFLSGLAGWFDFIHSERKKIFLGVLALQVLAVLTYEITVVFPLFALFLMWVYVGDKKTRRYLLFRYVILLFVVQLACVVVNFLDSSLVMIFSRKTSVSAVSLLGPRIIDLIHALTVPILVPGRGYFVSGHLADDMIRFLPLVVFFAGSFFLLVRDDSWRRMLDLCRSKNIMVCIALITISILPFMANKLMFVHTTRYLYLPLAAFSVLFGIVSEFLMSAGRGLNSRKHALICGAVLVYVFSMNILNTSFHFQSYQKYLVDHPECSFDSQVDGMFAEPAIK